MPRKYGGVLCGQPIGPKFSGATSTYIHNSPLMEVEVKETSKIGGVLGQMIEMEHEQVVFCNDPETGLRAIIAVHNTVLGPALGGCRMWNYASEAEALWDVLRLSRGMTFKNAVSGLNLGGGKAVIIGDARKQKNEALMRRFGQFVDSLGGKYITAEDVGMETSDMNHIHEETDHVAGIDEAMGGSGNPSPVTAYGVFMGMKAASTFRWGSDMLKGRRVMVQGVGHVGEALVDYLVEEGAEVLVTDIHSDRLDAMKEEFDLEIVAPDAVYDQNVDIYAPCAMGATLNDNSIPRLKCAIVAGAANNQLANEIVHGKMLRDRGILYAPDFVINAGGVINVYSEVKGFDSEMSMKMAENIYNTTLGILTMADSEGITPQEAAIRTARQRIDSIARTKSRW